MGVETNQVFLVPGQYVEQPGVTGLSAPDVKYCVVVAPDAATAHAAVSQAQAGFQPLGLTSLAAYEDAVVKIRQVLAGEFDEWPLVVAPEMEG